MIEVFFTCKSCNIVKVKTKVRFRKPDEPLGDWMEAVGYAIKAMHATKSPWCMENTMANVLIPTPTQEDQLLGTDPDV